MYTEDPERLDEMVRSLKARGMTKANRSALIRHALSQVDLDKIPKGFNPLHSGRSRQDAGRDVRISTIVRRAPRAPRGSRGAGGGWQPGFPGSR